MMLEPRLTVCVIALAFTVASSSPALAWNAPPRAASALAALRSDPWVRAVEPRAGAALKIELGGDPTIARDIQVKIRDAHGRPVPFSFPTPGIGTGTGPIQILGPELNREYRGFTIEVRIVDPQTGAVLAASSSSIA